MKRKNGRPTVDFRAGLLGRPEHDDKARVARARLLAHTGLRQGEPHGSPAKRRGHKGYRRRCRGRHNRGDYRTGSARVWGGTALFCFLIGGSARRSSGLLTAAKARQGMIRWRFALVFGWLALLVFGGCECNRLWLLKNSIFSKTAEIWGIENVLKNRESRL